MADENESLDTILTELLEKYDLEFLIPIFRKEKIDSNNIIFLEASLLNKYFADKSVGDFCNFCAVLDRYKKYKNVSIILFLYFHFL